MLTKAQIVTTGPLSLVMLNWEVGSLDSFFPLCSPRTSVRTKRSRTLGDPLVKPFPYRPCRTEKRYFRCRGPPFWSSDPDLSTFPSKWVYRPWTRPSWVGVPEDCPYRHVPKRYTGLDGRSYHRRPINLKNTLPNSKVFVHRVVRSISDIVEKTGLERSRCRSEGTER